MSMEANVTTTDPGIDFVLLWVDGNDPAWRAKKARYSPVEASTANVGDERYRDWGLLRYWFRGVEKFAPWVRKVFFVTDDQWPDWLNFNAPKLVRVRHSDFMPPECLPTFCSRAIEVSLVHLADLSEQFVLFNDDMFLCNQVYPEDFFRHGLPVDEATLDPVVATYPLRPVSYAMLNETAVVNRHCERARKAVLRRPGNWLFPWRSGCRGAFWNLVYSLKGPFPGFRDPHLPYILLKSTLREVWNAEPKILQATSMQKFRSHEDVSPRVFRFWQYATGRFTPRRPGSLGSMYPIIPGNVERLCKAIRTQREPLICANDMRPLSKSDFEKFQEDLKQAFSSILPMPSSFEK